MNWILSKTPPGDEHNEVDAIILDNGIARRKVMWYDVKNKEWSEDGSGKVYKYVVCWMPLNYLDQAIEKAKPNLDKIKDVDLWVNDIKKGIVIPTDFPDKNYVDLTGDLNGCPHIKTK